MHGLYIQKHKDTSWKTICYSHIFLRTLSQSLGASQPVLTSKALHNDTENDQYFYTFAINLQKLCNIYRIDYIHLIQLLITLHSKSI